MSRLTRDGTAEPVSRGQILRREREQGKLHFPFQLTTSRIGNNTGLTQTRLNELVIHTRFSLSMEMSRLTRDGTAEPVSRDQILRHARGRGNIIFPVQLTTSRIGNLTRLIRTLLYVMTIHTYIHALSHAARYLIPPIPNREGQHAQSSLQVKP